MAISDPVADMLTRIRNALHTRAPKVRVLRNRVCLGLAQVLKDEGYIHDFTSIDDGKQGVIDVQLKYGDRGEMVVQHLRRASKPGCRRYLGVADLPNVCDGLGIAVLSTNRGILSDRQCRKQNVGGEVLCTVW